MSQASHVSQVSPDGRYVWNGTAWVPAAPPAWGPPPWKGARFGRPPAGPGSLAEPGTRLAARVLDGLLTIPATVVLGAVAIALVAPHAGEMFPASPADPNEVSPTPGFVWVTLAVMFASFILGALAFLYEALTTARYGRTLGKAWMHIRPVTVDGAPLSIGRAFARPAVNLAFGMLSWIGMLDPLWCLWDEDRQCLHDKVVGTLVVRD